MIGIMQAVPDPAPRRGDWVNFYVVAPDQEWPLGPDESPALICWRGKVVEVAPCSSAGPSPHVTVDLIRPGGPPIPPGLRRRRLNVFSRVPSMGCWGWAPVEES